MPHGGFETPMYRYVPYNGPLDLAAAAACGPVEVHVVGVGRFRVGPDLSVTPIALIHGAERARVHGRVSLSELLRAAHRVRVVGGDLRAWRWLRFSRDKNGSIVVGLVYSGYYGTAVPSPLHLSIGAKLRKVITGDRYLSTFFSCM